MLRFDPFRDFDRMSTQMARPTRSMLAFDALRSEDAVTVHFDVPGVTPEDISVSVEKNELTVTVERRFTDRDEEERVIASERPQGSFTRQLMLSDALDTEKLEADLEEGVLTVTIPVAETAKERRVEVRSGGKRSAIETTSSERGDDEE